MTYESDEARLIKWLRQTAEKQCLPPRFDPIELFKPFGKSPHPDIRTLAEAIRRTATLTKPGPESLRCALSYVSRALQNRRENWRMYSDSDEGHQTWIDALDMVKQHLQGVEREVIKTPRGSSAAAAIRQSIHPPPTVAEDSIQDDDSSPASVLGTTSVSESIPAREPESKSEPQPRSELEAEAGDELDAEAELSDEPEPKVELAPGPVDEPARLPVDGDDIFDLTKATEKERRRLSECEGKWQQKLKGEKRVESAKTLVALGCAGLIGWVLAKLYSVST